MVDRYSSEIIAVITALEWDNAPTSSVLRVALFGGMYDQPDNTSGIKVHYQGCIKSDILFKKQIGIEFWKEESSIDFGYLDIALENQDDEFINFGKEVIAAKVEFYRVNLSSPSESELEILAAALTTDIGFSNDFTMRLRLTSILQDKFEAAINERYYGYEAPHLTGKPYPIAWGLISDPWQVLETVEFDPTQLHYHVTDIEIDTIEGYVYDRGVVLFDETPYDEFDPTTYGFVLNQNPDGRITCGRILCKDPLDTGNYFHGLFRHFRLAMTRAGLWTYANQYELQQLEDDIAFGDLFPQFFTMKTTSLASYMKTILMGVTGWYFVDEVSEVHFGRMTDPDDQTSIPFVFTDTNMVGLIKVEDDKAPGLTTRLGYAYSPGAYDEDEIAGSVSYGRDRVDLITEELIVSSDGYYKNIGWTADSEQWTVDSTVYTADGYAGQEFVEPTTSSYWTSVEVRTPIPIAIGYSESPDAFGLAEQEVTRWWSELYYKRRRFYTFKVKLNDSQFDAGLPQLGEFCTIQSDRFKLIADPIILFIRRLEFNFSKNLLTIEGWG
jgi:hypothetical protein